MSTPVAPLGTGRGGGVELTLRNLAGALQLRGHGVTVVAPSGSKLDGVNRSFVDGLYQIPAQRHGRGAPISMPAGSVLAAMWDEALQIQHQHDVLINFAYDWLPFYLTPFFKTPVAHLVSMGSMSDAMDEIIGAVVRGFPGRVAVHSRSQAATFAFGDQCRVLSNGLRVQDYEYCAEPQSHLGWVGRIAPEKGLEDALAAVARMKIPLKIWGAMEDEDYWKAVRQLYPDAVVTYEGFLPTKRLQAGLRLCRGLLVTPKWVEAFGNVAMEALACGVPVIAYRRGGPSEIVADEATGFLVEPDSIDGLVQAVGRLPQISRRVCRERAEREYSLKALGERCEEWLVEILGLDQSPTGRRRPSIGDLS